MNLILFGYKRCGKTHFGKRLAKLLNLPFVDNDKLIEKLHGQGLVCREIALKEGEAAFRTLESQAIAQLAEAKNSIISVGGGAVLNPGDLMLLQSIGKLVYLDVPKETIKKRTLSGDLPSYLDPDNPEGSFEKMYAARKPNYEKIPAYRLDARGKTEEAILEELKDLYGQ